MNKIHNEIWCLKCKKKFSYENSECFWDYSNYTPVKLIKCSKCGCINPVEYIEEKNVNLDVRYYEYGK